MSIKGAVSRSPAILSLTPIHRLVFSVSALNSTRILFDKSPECWPVWGLPVIDKPLSYRHCEGERNRHHYLSIWAKGLRAVIVTTVRRTEPVPSTLRLKAIFPLLVSE